MKSDNKKNSTFNRLMKDPKRKERFDKGYRSFLLSEVLCELMENNQISVRELAKKANVSPTTIQNIRSGKKKNVTLVSIGNILQSLGCNIIIKNKKSEYSI